MKKDNKETKAIDAMGIRDELFKALMDEPEEFVFNGVKYEKHHKGRRRKKLWNAVIYPEPEHEDDFVPQCFQLVHFKAWDEDEARDLIAAKGAGVWCLHEADSSMAMLIRYLDERMDLIKDQRKYCKKEGIAWTGYAEQEYQIVKNIYEIAVGMHTLSKEIVAK